MKLFFRLAAIIFILFSLSSAAFAQNDMRYFITRAGDRLLEGAKEYRFISFNIPNLHLVEDNMAFEATNEWRFPDEFEITDALQSIKQMGGRVARLYVISICRKEGPNPIPCHVKRPGEFNEEAFRALDKVLEVANRTGVRVIIPLVDNWKWWGGAEQYAEHRGRPAEAFWTDPEIIQDFKQTIQFVINRRNTYTGTLYKDDKAILAWETGNELYSPYSWTKDIAAYIKSLDRNHLVWDGFYIGNREIQVEALSDPNIDIVSSHHYPAPNRNMLEEIEKFRQQIAGKKVYILGEFGFVPLSDIRKILDAVIQKNISGAMIWSLRYHNRDGGFYWHSEPSGGLLYKAYHYPGFATGETYTEVELIKLMREKAFEIRGIPLPPFETPAPPLLLPVKSVDEISWRGSVGASAYDVERATKQKGAWMVVGANIDDTLVQYRPLFADESAEPGHSYYYRVRAKNASGASAPSNTVGPVRALFSTIVDELGDYTHTFAHGGTLSLETANPRPYKEDAHRLKGSAESWVTYRTPEPLRSARVLAFMEGEGKDFEFYLSQDGNSFTKVEAKVSRFPTAVNPYGYKLPLQYELSSLPPNSYFLKIAFRADAQVSRVELRFGKGR
jgi:mannan endo-1,4-beta-mannosidase